MGYLKKTLLFCLIVYGSFNYSLAQETINDNSSDIIVYVDTGSPLKNNNGKLNQAGLRLEKVKEYLNKKNLTYKINFLPWVRAYRQITLEDNALIFDIMRTPDREKKFHWLLKTNSHEYGRLMLFGKNTKEFTTASKQKILSNKYSAVCANGSVQCQILKDFGFSENQLLVSSGSTNGIYEQMILRDRVNFMLGYKGLIEESLTMLGQDINALAPLFDIGENHIYLAAPKNIKSELLEKLRD